MRKKEEYLSMSQLDFIKSLATDVMRNVDGAKLLVEDFMKMRRYETDHSFRVLVDAIEALLTGVMGNYEEMIPLCNDVIERANSYKIWSAASLAWNTLGNAYYILEMYEKAIECYFNAIKNDERSGVSLFIATSYNNIALIFLQLKDHAGSKEFFKLTLDTIEEIGEDLPRYSSRKISCLGNIALEMVQEGNMEEAKKVLEEIESFDLSDITQDALLSYHTANMFYRFKRKEADEGIKGYLECRKYIMENNVSQKLLILCFYIELCEEINLPAEYYEKELEEVKGLIQDSNASYGSWLYQRFRNYYKILKDEKKYQEATEQYIAFLEKESEEKRVRQANSIRMLASFFKESKKVEKISHQNKELLLMAEEAEAGKNELQKAYSRIEMINRLGRKLTSSLDINEVIELIYKNLQDNVPLDVFVLMVVDKESDTMHSLVQYIDGDSSRPKKVIDLKDSESVFSECYRKGEMIVSMDEEYQIRAKVQITKNCQRGKRTDLPSAIYFPLKVKEEIVGICSIQYTVANFYTEKHVRFLEDFSPYLSIALNNALKSGELEKEISSHVATKHQLEKANKRLEKISSMDGLTSINSRRVFEQKIIQFLRASKSLQTTVSIFMLDIDNFKLYNDTYGHLQGDDVLKKVAQVFKQDMDEEAGLSARFGGEEFIGACLGLNLEESERLAERIRNHVYELGISHEASPLERISISVGVSVAEQVDEKYKSELMRLADDNLYEAKNSGKNRVVISKFQ